MGIGFFNFNGLLSDSCINNLTKKTIIEKLQL